MTAEGSANPGSHRQPLQKSAFDIKAFLCLYAFMRTTIDLPEDIFREAKTRAVQQGTTLKNLISRFIESGLAAQGAGISTKVHRPPPPVAIRRIQGQAPTPALSNRELHAILEAEDIDAARGVSAMRCIKA